MSEPAPRGWSTLPSRLAPISGGIVLTLTATPWLQHTTEAEADDLQRTYTLWGMLATVNQHLLPLLILAIALLLAYAVVSIVLPPERMLVRSVLGWLAVASAAGIMLTPTTATRPGPARSSPWWSVRSPRC